MKSPISWLIPWLLVACAPPSERAPRKKTDPLIDSASTLPIDSGTTDTGTVVAPPEPWYDCENVGQPPFVKTEIDIYTEEDFDFDGDGYLIHQANGDLVGVSATADWKIIAPQVSADPAGLSVLASGRIAVAAPSTGSINLYDPLTGGHTLVASGLSRVNSIDIGLGDILYFSESAYNGRVSSVDATNLVRGTVLEGVNTPNGVALSPDEATIYITGTDGGLGYVLAVDRTAEGWGSPRTIFEVPGDYFAAVEVDVCGTLWMVSFDSGRIVRFDPVTQTAEPVGELGGSLWSNTHFGNGIGGWRRDTLYVTNRSVVVAVSVGVPGRQHPSNPYDGPDP